MRKIAQLLLLTLLISPLASLAHNKDDITIAGSTTILPISEKWAKVYRDKTGVKVNVHGGGSTGGIKATKIGTADIGACSRELSSDEKHALKEIVIGRDALGIIVNKKNPIGNLTTKQARRIFAGKIKNWKEIGGPDKPILVVNRESGSGTRNSFEEIVMRTTPTGRDGMMIPMTLKAVVSNSNAEVKENVKMVPYSIGYVSVGFIDDKVKALNINDVQPTIKNISSGNYPLVRNLYFLVKETQNNTVANFLKYVLSNEGQSYIIREGFYPVTN